MRGDFSYAAFATLSLLPCMSPDLTLCGRVQFTQDERPNNTPSGEDVIV